MLKDELRFIVRAQAKNVSKLGNGIKREKLRVIKPAKRFALIITGVRRCGKSTLLRQMMSSLGKSYYLNFEDPRITEFSVKDFNKLNEDRRISIQRRTWFFRTLFL